MAPTFFISGRQQQRPVFEPSAAGLRLDEVCRRHSNQDHLQARESFDVLPALAGLPERLLCHSLVL